MDNEKNWTVYLHTVPKEVSGYDWDKYYVGITSQNNPANRWGLNGNNYKGQVFYNAIEKYGWGNICHEILYTGLTEKQALKKEMDLISEYKSTMRDGHGYNISPGSENGSNQGSGIYNSFYGHKHSDKTKQIFSERSRGGNNPNSKTLYQFTFDGDFVGKYPSAAEAGIAINRKKTSKDNITAAARNHKTCGGYLWAYEEGIYFDSEGNCHIKQFPKSFTRDISNIYITDGKTVVPIYQFDNISHEFVKRYDSITIAAAEAGQEVGSIYMSANKKYKYSKKYNSIWRHEKDVGFTEDGEPFFIA